MSSSLRTLRQLITIPAVFLLAATVAACGSDSGTQPQLFDGSVAVTALTLRSEPIDNVEDVEGIEVVATVILADGARAAGVPVTFTTTGGDFIPGAEALTDSRGEARVRLVGDEEEIVVTAHAGDVESPELVASLRGVFQFTFEFKGRADAREVETITVRATDRDGNPVRGTLRVDFGDGRDKTYDFSRRLALTHVYRESGSYRIRVVLTDADNQRGRASFRLRVGEPVPTSINLEGPRSAKPDEAATFTVSAVRSDKEAVKGTVEIDFGDGSSETVADFARRASVDHTYAAEGEYDVTARLEATNGKSARASLSLRVSDLQNGDELDVNQVTFLHANVADWTVSSQVTGVSINRSQICIFHTKAGKWPVFDTVEGNPWVVANVGGRWYAATYEWLKPGQACKGVTAANLGQHIKKAPLASWKPRKGDELYFFVSTIARFADRTSNERSNLKQAIWPY